MADRLKPMMTGLEMLECPRWHKRQLWFADWGPGEIVRVDARGGKKVMARAAAPPLSFDFLPDGGMLVVGAGDGRVRIGAKLETYADGTALGPNGWNEIVVDAEGRAYINAAGFDMMGGEAFKPGIVALATPDGGVREVADGVAFPNGMAITPDGSTLVVAESYGRKLTAFTIRKNGTLSKGRVWADLGEGTPDGICFDAEGAIWYADVPNQRCVRVAEGGKVLDTIDVDRGCFACMLGGAKRTTLFILANEWRGREGIGKTKGTGVVYAVTAPSPGAGFPSPV
jgi:sugar lactone lactonase YvrE